MSGWPTAPSRMASQGCSRSSAPEGIILPQRKKCDAPHSKSWNAKLRSCLRPACSSTRLAWGTTSKPTPSPAITAMVRVFMEPSFYPNERPALFLLALRRHGFHGRLHLLRIAQIIAAQRLQIVAKLVDQRHPRGDVQPYDSL